MLMTLGMVACSDNNGSDSAQDPAGKASATYNPEADEDGDC